VQRKIRDIYATIQHSPARTAWEKGVRACADDLFSDYIEKALGILDIEVRIGKITEADLLRGAPNWDRYSRGGMALVSNMDIIRRFYPKSRQKKLLEQMGSEFPLDLLDVQANALTEAAALVVWAVNLRRDET
jgi:hypothetical protein